MVRIYKSPGHKTYILYPVLPALFEDVRQDQSFQRGLRRKSMLGSILIKSLIPRHEARFSNDSTLGDMPGTRRE